MAKVDESKQVWPWFILSTEVDYQCCCGERLIFTNIEDDPEIKHCSNCGQPWRIYIDISMVDGDSD